jgi:hypothetical protein
MSTPCSAPLEDRVAALERELEDVRAERETLVASFRRVCVLAGWADPGLPPADPPAPARGDFPRPEPGVLLRFPGRSA